MLTTDPVTMALLQASAKGSQSVVQRLVMRFVNVEDKVGFTVTEVQYCNVWEWRTIELGSLRKERMRNESIRGR